MATNDSGRRPPDAELLAMGRPGDGETDEECADRLFDASVAALDRANARRRKEIEVVLPSTPPTLTSGAARALLGINEATDEKPEQS